MALACQFGQLAPCAVGALTALLAVRQLVLLAGSATAHILQAQVSLMKQPEVSCAGRECDLQACIAAHAELRRRTTARLW